MKTERKNWGEAHEGDVERFYEAGIGHDLDWHGGYRNFGWWDEGQTDYLVAADRLVLEMGRRLGLNAESTLLDVACGGAPQDVLLHREFGTRIEGVDVTFAQVVQGQKRVADADIGEHVHIQHGTATNLPFDDERFTHVLCIEGAQHFDTREAFFHQAISVMKPGAVMCLADFMVLTPAKSAWEKFCVRRAQKLWNVPDANVLNEADFRASLERAGFTDIEFEGVGKHTIPGYYLDQCTPETIADHKKYKGRAWRFKMNFTNYFMFKAWEKRLMEYV
ncbi:MAG: cyclopropane fatty-acyl-phospholipid synthase-like methyltransferase, partial [Myxococcota bacterium]